MSETRWAVSQQLSAPERQVLTVERQPRHPTVPLRFTAAPRGLQRSHRVYQRLTAHVARSSSASTSPPYESRELRTKQTSSNSVRVSQIGVYIRCISPIISCRVSFLGVPFPFGYVSLCNLRDTSRYTKNTRQIHQDTKVSNSQAQSD
jgi:hypothetical protein